MIAARIRKNFPSGPDSAAFALDAIRLADVVRHIRRIGLILLDLLHLPDIFIH